MDSRFNVDDLALTESSSGVGVEAGDSTIITTPLVQDAWELFENCRITSAIGAITGPSGTGKSSALRAISNRFIKAGYSGNTHILKCCSASGPTSGVRALLIGMGVGGSITSNRTAAGLAFMLKLALRELQQREISVVLFDDADYFSTDSLQGLVNLFDAAKDAGRPIVMIFSGVKSLGEWLGQLPAAATRTLHVQHTAAMTEEMTAAVLKKMGTSLQTLVVAYKKKDKAAKETIAAIHRQTGGNFRRIRYFADLALAKTKGPLTLETVEAILAQMQS